MIYDFQSSQRDWHLSVDPHTQMLVPLAKVNAKVQQFCELVALSPHLFIFIG